MVLAASPEGGKPIARRRSTQRRPARRDQRSVTRRLGARSESPCPMIDSHCHLADEAFAADLDAVVARAQRGRASSGARASSRARRADGSWRARRGVPAAWPAVRFAVGVHPHAGRRLRRTDPRRRGATVARGSTRRPARARSARSASTTTTTSRRATCSRRSSARRSRWRASCDLPVVIHTREADDDTLAILARGRRGPRARRAALLHRRRRRWPARALDLGLLHLARGHRDVPEGGRRCAKSAALVPADRLLVETDARFWRRCRTAASGTSRPGSSRRSSGRGRPCAASARPSWTAQVARELRRAVRPVTPRADTLTPRETYGLMPRRLTSREPARRDRSVRSRRQKPSVPDLAQIFEPIRADLERVEREFARHVESQVDAHPADRPATSRRAAASASARPCC